MDRQQNTLKKHMWRLNLKRRRAEDLPGDIAWMQKRVDKLANTLKVPHELRYKGWSTAIKQHLLANKPTTCPYCRAALNYKFGGNVHLDHIKPAAKYPELILSPKNLQILCGRCNVAKADMTPLELLIWCRTVIPQLEQQTLTPDT